MPRFYKRGDFHYEWDSLTKTPGLFVYQNPLFLHTHSRFLQVLLWKWRANGIHCFSKFPKSIKLNENKIMPRLHFITAMNQACETCPLRTMQEGSWLRLCTDSKIQYINITLNWEWPSHLLHSIYLFSHHLHQLYKQHLDHSQTQKSQTPAEKKKLPARNTLALIPVTVTPTQPTQSCNIWKVRPQHQTLWLLFAKNQEFYEHL